jgi:predicted amidohydrolase
MISKSFLYNEQAASKRLKVASVAMTCDRDPEVNRIKIARTLDRIAGAAPDVGLVVFGEMILGWYKPSQMPAYHRRISAPISREVQGFAPLAKQHKIHLCFGMSEIDGGRLHNTQVLLSPQGEIQAVHRKWNLKPGEWQADYQPGPVPITITDVKGIRTAIVICSDAASPRAMRELMRSRVDMIILSLADDGDKDLFMARFNARIYDAWIVTANRYGDEDGYFWNGHLVISDPCGELRVTGRDKEQFLIYELGFVDQESWLKRVIRQAWVKTPLIWHILRNWKRAKSYL